MDRGGHGVAKMDTTEQLNNNPRDNPLRQLLLPPFFYRQGNRLKAPGKQVADGHLSRA